MNRDKIIKILQPYTFSDYHNLYDAYRKWLVRDKVEPTTYFPDYLHGTAAFVFRCNQPIDFNNIRRNNDLLVIMHITDKELSIINYFIPVTADPFGQKDKIAHLSAQIYRGNRGLHRGIAGRLCIRSDFGVGTWINRTNPAGITYDLNPDERFTSVPGHFGINIHDSAGLYNSSLGCVIIPSIEDYSKFKLTLLSTSNADNIPVCVFDMDDLPEIIPEFKDE